MAMPFCSLICRSLINRVNTLEGKLAQLESRLAALQNSNVMDLNPYVTVQTAGTPKVLFSGINVQIVNGLDRTDSINGLGNLIIGYDKARPEGGNLDALVCSIGGTATWADDITYHPQQCTAAGGTIAVNHKNGSHYLVVGDEHNYSQYGGVVFGHYNTSNRAWATVTGGERNHAGGEAASVTGGVNALAQGRLSSITGGSGNYADSSGSSVSGGERNTANAAEASVCGGVKNTASGRSSHVSGGNNNTAREIGSSILGGVNQTTTTSAQTIPSLP